MKTQTFPSERAWKRHTRRAAQVGLSAGALACLGTEPHARPDPTSFTGYIGTVRILTRDDALTAGRLAAQAIGPAALGSAAERSPADRGVRARRDAHGSTYTLFVPISRQAARELARPKRVPNTPSPGQGERTEAYNLIMRPTSRARLKARDILAEK